MLETLRAGVEYNIELAVIHFGQGLLDLAGFPPYDGQTAVIKKRL
jgi:hypothetical protein